MQELNPLMAAIGGAFTESVRKMVETHMTYLWNENANVVAALTAKVAALEAQLAGQAAQAAQVETLGNQEWFWAKVATFVQAENAKLAPSPADLVAEVDWSEQLDYGKIIEHVSMAVLAGELTANQLEEIAEEIDLSDLANELDADKLMKNFDLDQALRDWFGEQSFSISA